MHQKRAGERHRRCRRRTATAQMPAAIDEPQRKRPAPARSAGAPAAAPPRSLRRTSRASAPARCATRPGSTARARQPRAAEPLGIARQDERTPRNAATQRGARQPAPPSLTARTSVLDAPPCPDRTTDERRQQHQHRDQVEQPLHHDRRERRRRAQALLPRQQIRPDHVAGARRQHALTPQSRSPSCETRSRTASARSAQQVLPADGPDRT